MPSSAPIKAGEAYIELWADSTKLGKALKGARAKLEAFAAGAKTVGQAMTKAASTMLLPIGAGAKVYADFERQMAEVATLLDNPAVHMEKFRRGVRDMAVAFGESTDTLAKGLYDIISASVAPAQALDVLAVSARAAEGGITDTGTAADAITTVLNAYNLEAEQAGDVSDWLFGVVKRGKTTFGELAPNIGKVATLAANAQISLEELGAMMAVLTRNGLKTEKAITGINAVISTFLKPQAEAIELAESLGFELSASALAVDGLEASFSKIADLPPDAIVKLFPNIRAIKGLLPALKDMEGFSEDVLALQERAGLAEKAYERMAKTVSHKFNAMKEAGLDALRSIGEAVAGSLTKVFESAQQVAKGMGQWLDKNQDLVRSVAKLAVVVGAAGAAIWAIGAVAGAVKGILLGVAAAVGILQGAFTLLAAHPVAAALLGIAAATAAVVYGLRKMHYHIADLSDAQRKAREEADKLRKADLELFRRLEQLTAKERLSNTEKEQAAKIVKHLTDEYDNLGLRIDKMTGKVYGLASAEKHLTEQMRAERMSQFEAEYAERIVNMGELHAQIVGLGSVFSFKSREAAEAQIDALMEKVHVERMHAEAILQAMKALRGGEEAALTAPVPAVASEVPGQAGQPSPETDPRARMAQAAQLQEDLDETLHELRLAQIDHEEKRELRRIGQVYAKKLQKAKEAGAAESQIVKAREAEQAAIRKRFAREREAEEKRRAAERQTAKTEAEAKTAATAGFDPKAFANAAQLQQDLDRRLHELRLGQIEDEEQRELVRVAHIYAEKRKLAQGNEALETKIIKAHEAEREAIRKRFAKEREAEKKRRAAERAAMEDSIAYQIQQAQIELTTEGVERQKKLLGLEKARAVKEAIDAGMDPAEVRRLYDLRMQISEKANAPTVAKSVQGTFQGVAAALFGGVASSPEKQTEKNTKRTADAAEQTARLLGRLRLKFS